MPPHRSPQINSKFFPPFPPGPPRVRESGQGCTGDCVAIRRELGGRGAESGGCSGAVGARNKAEAEGQASGLRRSSEQCPSFLAPGALVYPSRGDQESPAPLFWLSRTDASKFPASHQITTISCPVRFNLSTPSSPIKITSSILTPNFPAI